MQKFLRLDATGTGLALLLCLVASGCASSGRHAASRAPTATAANRTDLGRIAIVDRARSTEFAYELPNVHVRRETLKYGVVLTSTVVGGVAGVAGMGAAIVSGSTSAQEAGGGETLGALGVGLAGGMAVGAAAGFAIMPVGAAVGALHDAVLNENSRKVRQATPAVARTLDGLDFEGELQQRFLLIVQTQTVHEVTLATLPQFDTTWEAPTTSNIYRSLRERGVDTVVEISGNGAFEAQIGWHNPFKLRADVWFTVVDLAQGRELFSDHAHHESKSRKFVSWAKDDARLLKEELNRCYNRMSKRMARQLALAAP